MRNKLINLKIIDNIWLTLCGLYIFYSTISRTAMQLEIFDGVLHYIYSACLIISIIRYIACFKYNFKCICAAIILIISLITFSVSKSYTTAFIGILIFGSIDFDYKRIVSLQLIILVLVIIIMAILDGSAIVNHAISIRDNVLGSAFGFNSRPQFASYILFFLIIFWTFGCSNNNISTIALSLFGFTLTYFGANYLTSSICIAVFIILILYYILQNKVFSKSKIFLSARSIIKWPVIISFFIFACLSIYVVMKYAKGDEMIKSLDAFVHGRIKLPYEAFLKYGIKPFGTYFEMKGYVNSTADIIGYNYLDNCYLLLLIRYGVIPFIMIGAIISYMLYKAYKCNNIKLVISIIVILGYSLSQHDMINIDYNIILILPFTTLFDKEYEICNEDLKYPVLFILIFAIISFILLKPFTSYLMTFYELCVKEKMELSRMLAFLFVAIPLLLIIFIFYSLFKNKNIDDGNPFNSNQGKYKFLSLKFLCPLIFIILYFSLFFIVSHNYIGVQLKNNEKLIKYFNAESDLITNVLGIADNDVYIDKLPVAYNKKFGHISYNFLHGEDLARFKPNTVIMEHDDDTNIFLNLGYKVCEMSPYHVLYTTDEGVIKALSDSKYPISDKYVFRKYVNLEELASLNGLLYEDGALVIDGVGRYIRKGPYDVCKYGTNHEMTIKMHCDDILDKNRELCKIRITAANRELLVKEVPIYGKSFDDAGNADIKIGYFMGNYDNIEYLINMSEYHKIRISEISYIRK